MAGLRSGERVTYIRDRLGSVLLLLQLRGAAKVVMVGGYQGFPSEDLKWATYRQAYPTTDSRCGVLDLRASGRPE